MVDRHGVLQLLGFDLQGQISQRPRAQESTLEPRKEVFASLCEPLPMTAVSIQRGPSCSHLRRPSEIMWSAELG